MGDLIEIAVTDDGAGRRKAKELNSHGTQSGLEMLRQVHSIFNRHNAKPITQRYEDDYLGDHGTKVIIHLPKSYTYEL